jgi:hypothetical protein
VTTAKQYSHLLKSQGTFDSASEDDENTTLLSGSESKSEDKTGEVNTSKKEKPRIKKARFSRRHLSQSEPSGHRQGSMDGTHESDIMGSGSDDIAQLADPPALNIVRNPPELHLPLLAPNSLKSQSQHHRHVSAPSNPPLSHSDLRGAHRGVRIRRPRHWRLKNRAADASRQASATTSTENGSDGTGITAPVTSPAESHSTPTVRFADEL